MDNNQIVAQLAANLVEAATRNTASIITNKIAAIKAKKNDKEAIGELEEIISELLSDKAEIQRIAQSYEQELVSQRITEKDIKYITDNLPWYLQKQFKRGAHISEILSLIEQDEKGRSNRFQGHQIHDFMTH